MTRKEAEKIVRQVIASHAGEPMPPNLFKDSVDQFLAEVNREVNDNGETNKIHT